MAEFSSDFLFVYDFFDSHQKVKSSLLAFFQGPHGMSIVYLDNYFMVYIALINWVSRHVKMLFKKQLLNTLLF